MLDQILAIANMIIDSFLHIWPYLLVTIPLAVAVQMSGASKYINRAFQARPIAAVFLATAVGAFSPFCSCGVVPVVAALLIGGVPLAPVMSFWIASPSMDPEAFFLSVATVGWELAVWRLAATLVLSLSAGLITHFVVQRGWLGQRILRTGQGTLARPVRDRLQTGWRRLKRSLTRSPSMGIVAGGATLSPAVACCRTTGTGSRDLQQPTTASVTMAAPGGSANSGPAESASRAATECAGLVAIEGDSCGSSQGNSCSVESDPFWRRLFRETWSATWMVVKFMALAFFVSALIKLYVPATWVAGLLGSQNPWAIPMAALLGVPAYASNLTALPMLSGLLAQGMNPSAALAFLISGPVTTLPAMAAVWGLASRRVFALYVSFSLIGAVVLGYLHSLMTSLL
jgi:uncharacterized membrane protein YraQ (UPF0718 family)